VYGDNKSIFEKPDSAFRFVPMGVANFMLKNKNAPTEAIKQMEKFEQMVLQVDELKHITAMKVKSKMMTGKARANSS
jgi:hypothetical protein